MGRVVREIGRAGDAQPGRMQDAMTGLPDDRERPIRLCRGGPAAAARVRMLPAGYGQTHIIRAAGGPRT